jgi:hypothetical protein
MTGTAWSRISRLSDEDAFFLLFFLSSDPEGWAALIRALEALDQARQAGGDDDAP